MCPPTIIDNPQMQISLITKLKLQYDNHIFAASCFKINKKIMQHEDGKEWALSRIGICEKPDPKFCDPFEYNEIMENENVLVRYQLRANYQARRGEKTGFWDIILVHQKPIPQVPKDMRP